MGHLTQQKAEPPMFRLRPAFFIMGLSFAVLSCQSNQEFDAGKWSQQENGIYPNRSKMIEDLTTTQPLAGLPYTDLKDLLGVPDRIDTTGNTTLFYNISDRKVADAGKPERLMFKLDDSLRVRSFTISSDPR